MAKPDPAHAWAPGTECVGKYNFPGSASHVSMGVWEHGLMCVWIHGTCACVYGNEEGWVKGVKYTCTIYM